jgi:hypothetical protein
MKNPTVRVVLTCIVIFMLPVVAPGQQAAKGLFSLTTDQQNAVTYDERGFAKLKKADLDGAMADYNQRLSSIQAMPPLTTIGELSKKRKAISTELSPTTIRLSA